MALAPSGNEVVLASNERGPVWVAAEQNGVRHFRSGFALPEVSEGGSFKDIFNGECFLELLPLVHWLRQLSSSAAYQNPPLRACFMFDDPNLHWPRYGFVDFRQIATHAEKENYHVSFATLPLDTWFTHKAAAEVFARNANRLSLLVHGNNHTYCELAQDYSPAERVALLHQAIHRIAGFESRTRAKCITSDGAARGRLFRGYVGRTPWLRI